MHRRRMAQAIALLLLLCAGVTALAVVVTWSGCLRGDGTACLAASRVGDAAIVPALTWGIGIVLAAVAAFVLGPTRPRALLAVGLLCVTNPLTDRGAFSVPWDTADTIPFTGSWIAFALLAADVLLYPRRRVERTAREQSVSSAGRRR